jgi:hypothetical protein
LNWKIVAVFINAIMINGLSTAGYVASIELGKLLGFFGVTYLELLSLRFDLSKCGSRQLGELPVSHRHLANLEDNFVIETEVNRLDCCGTAEVFDTAAPFANTLWIGLKLSRNTLDNRSLSIDIW